MNEKQLLLLAACIWNDGFRADDKNLISMIYGLTDSEMDFVLKVLTIWQESEEIPY